MKKIAIIGPVEPFRGGISHHTTSLTKALGKLLPTEVFSFSRLYPRLLYPGAFQTEKVSPPELQRPRFILDSLNPLTWRRTAQEVANIHPMAVVIPWWTAFLTLQVRTLTHQLSKTGVPVIIICHNLVDHEATKIKRSLSLWALEQASGFIVHSRQEEKALHRRFGNSSVLFHPHPIYDRFPVAQGLLSRKAKVELLFFGLIRPYKGLDILIDAIRISKSIDVHLTIVGEPWGHREHYWRQKIEAAGLSDRIDFVPHYVKDKDAAEYFHRADAVVLPYRCATGTGVAAIAYQYRKPVIASRTGGLSDVVLHGRTGYLFPPCDPRALSAAIQRLANHPIENLERNIEQQTKSMSWDHLANEMVNTFIPKLNKVYSGR
jgi:glycosyltransferase involved in cell wall biosynthesis